MKMTKLTAAAAGLLVAASLAFTSCGGLGKDDFYGLWQSSYEVTDENLLSKNTEVGNGDDNDSKLGSSVEIAMYFDGSSEKLINSTQKFYQFKTRTDKAGNLASSTFWIGNYKPSDNSNYTNGTLELDYRVGWGTSVKVTEEEANALGKAWLCSSAEDAYEVLKDTFTTISEPADDQELLDYLATVGSPSTYAEGYDLEKFDFELGDPSFLKGYQSLTATAKENCSWEVKSRTFSLQNTLSDLVKEMLDSADDSSATN